MFLSKRLSPYLMQLIYDAAHSSFWYKNSLRDFLRRVGIDGTLLAQLDPAGSKRHWLDFVFQTLEQSDTGQQLLLRVANDLAEQKTFPGLLNVENSKEKIAVARQAVAALRDAVERLDFDAAAEREAAAVRQRAEEVRRNNLRSTLDLNRLKERLDQLSITVLGTTQGGYDFETWFYDLMAYCDVDYRRPYKAPDGRQIDGSVTVDGTTYLVELKFTQGLSAVTDIDSFLRKVTEKADNTMGLMLSISGFDEGAKRNASGARSPLLLFDSQHLYLLVLNGVMTFPDVVRRVRRHSSQEGQAYLAPSGFGG